MNDDYVRQVLAWLHSALPLRSETLDTAWSSRTRLPAVPPRREGLGEAGARLPAIPQPGESPGVRLPTGSQQGERPGGADIRPPAISPHEAGLGEAGARLPVIPPQRTRRDGIASHPIVVPPQGKGSPGTRTPVRREWLEGTPSPLIPSPRLPTER